jgi:hypothetical protein
MPATGRRELEAANEREDMLFRWASSTALQEHAPATFLSKQLVCSRHGISQFEISINTYKRNSVGC